MLSSSEGKVQNIYTGYSCKCTCFSCHSLLFTSSATLMQYLLPNSHTYCLIVRSTCLFCKWHLEFQIGMRISSKYWGGKLYNTVLVNHLEKMDKLVNKHCKRKHTHFLCFKYCRQCFSLYRRDAPSHSAERNSEISKKKLGY